MIANGKADRRLPFDLRGQRAVGEEQRLLLFYLRHRDIIADRELEVEER